MSTEYVERILQEKFGGDVFKIGDAEKYEFVKPPIYQRAHTSVYLCKEIGKPNNTQYAAKVNTFIIGKLCLMI